MWNLPGVYIQNVPVRIAWVRCSPSVGCCSLILRSTSLICFVTLRWRARRCAVRGKRSVTRCLMLCCYIRTVPRRLLCSCEADAVELRTASGLQHAQEILRFTCGRAMADLVGQAIIARGLAA